MVVRLLRDGQGVPRHFLERGAASPAEALQKGGSRVKGGGEARPVKVLYVAGLGRSGSTILANTLGQVEGFFSGGELNFIWKHALIENRLCGCGTPPGGGVLGAPVYNTECGGKSEARPRERVRLHPPAPPPRHIPL